MSGRSLNLLASRRRAARAEAARGVAHIASSRTRRAGQDAATGRPRRDCRQASWRSRQLATAVAGAPGVRSPACRRAELRLRGPRRRRSLGRRPDRGQVSSGEPRRRPTRPAPTPNGGDGTVVHVVATMASSGSRRPTRRRAGRASGRTTERLVRAHRRAPGPASGTLALASRTTRSSRPGQSSGQHSPRPHISEAQRGPRRMPRGTTRRRGGLSAVARLRKSGPGQVKPTTRSQSPSAPTTKSALVEATSPSMRDRSTEPPGPALEPESPPPPRRFQRLSPVAPRGGALGGPTKAPRSSGHTNTASKIAAGSLVDRRPCRVRSTPARLSPPSPRIAAPRPSRSNTSMAFGPRPDPGPDTRSRGGLPGAGPRRPTRAARSPLSGPRRRRPRRRARSAPRLRVPGIPSGIAHLVH